MNIPEDSFFTELAEVSDRLHVDSFFLLSVWMSESSVKPDAYNPHGGASGIFQAMPDTLKGLGFDGNFRALTATEQLPWAEKYYAPGASKLTTRVACYLWTFLPADIALASNPDAVLVAEKGSPICPDGRRPTLFSVNSAFDQDGNHAIQVKELDFAVMHACRGPRWIAIRDRMRAELGLQPLGEVTGTFPNKPDVASLRGIQALLEDLGYQLGELDGLMGPRTHDALVVFQEANGLDQDGLPGPQTRTALLTAWRALGKS